VGEKEIYFERFRNVHLNFSRFYAMILTRMHLTLPQYALLNSLVTNGPMTMTEASRQLHLTKPAITHIVDQLTARQLLTRKRDEKDRRTFFLVPKPKGKATVKTIQGEAYVFMKKTMGKFKSGERETILGFMQLLASNIHEAVVGK